MKFLTALNGMFALLIVLLLAGCAAPNLDSGLAKFNAKDFRGAYADFVKCAGDSGDTYCMANAGVAAWNLGDTAAALRWWTLSARKGNHWAATILTDAGAIQPVITKPVAGK